MAGSWNKRNFKVPSNPNYSLIPLKQPMFRHHSDASYPRLGHSLLWTNHLAPVSSSLSWFLLEYYLFFLSLCGEH